jgi:hypothetical protein
MAIAIVGASAPNVTVAGGGWAAGTEEQLRNSLTAVPEFGDVQYPNVRGKVRGEVARTLTGIIP